MRYVVSDIHGNFSLFVKLLKKIKFSSNDEMFVLGDILDKGKDEIRLMKLLFGDLRENVVVLAGNHEYELIKLVTDLIFKDASDEMILKECKSYLQNENLTMRDVDDIMNMPFFIEDDDFVLVHAGLELDENGQPIPLEKTDLETLVYDRKFKDEKVLPKNYKCVIFGHTPTCFKSGMKGKIIKYQKPNTFGKSVKDFYKIQIDTGNFLTGILGCLRLDDMQEFYVSEFDC